MSKYIFILTNLLTKKAITLISIKIIELNLLNNKITFLLYIVNFCIYL